MKSWLKFAVKRWRIRKFNRYVDKHVAKVIERSVEGVLCAQLLIQQKPLPETDADVAELKRLLNLYDEFVADLESLLVWQRRYAGSEEVEQQDAVSNNDTE